MKISVTKNGYETFQLYTKLINCAKSNIILISTHCHGDALMHILEQLHNKIIQNPNIIIKLCFHKLFLSSSEWQYIYKLMTFSQISFKFFYTGNHIKLLSIDNNQWIIGGSGLNDIYHTSIEYIDDYQLSIMPLKHYDMDFYISNDAGINNGKPILIFNNRKNNMFYEHVIDIICSAKSSITLCHMYVNLTHKIIELLLNKINNENICLNIITCLPYNKSAIGQYIFSIRNKHIIQKIYHSIKKNKKNFNVYSFEKPNTTYHKKLIVVDDNKILAGNSNLGYKSLNGYYDYELNFQYSFNENDKELYNLLDIIEIDKKNSRKMNLKTIKLTFIETIINAIFNVLQYFIG